MVRRKKKEKEIVRSKARYSPVFDTLVYAIMLIIFLITLIPILYVISVSFTPMSEVVKAGGFVLLPRKIVLDAYHELLKDGSVLRGLGVTVRVTVIGTIANVVTTMLMAYPLSRKELPGNKWIMKLLVFTMIFSAGTIPHYLIVKATGLLNRFAAYVIPSLLSVHNLVIMKVFFENLPEDVFDAARIDGCNEFKILTRIVLPMSVPILLTIGMYYAVGHWNTYMTAVLYITDKDLQPVQVLLRRILTMNTLDTTADVIVPSQSLRMAGVCFCTLPIVIVYPFIQKHFVKGTLLGAVKG